MHLACARCFDEVLELSVKTHRVDAKVPVCDRCLEGSESAGRGLYGVAAAVHRNPPLARYRPLKHRATRSGTKRSRRSASQHQQFGCPNP